MRKRKKVLCVCAQGLNRSKYLAGYLRNKEHGYNTRYGGATIEAPNPIHQKDIEWADVIIVVRKRLVPIMKERFHIDSKRKKLIVLNVADSPFALFFENRKLKFSDYFDFQNKYTYPKLRRKIEKYLPL
ncbi:MAG: hypothetical protein AABW91_04260 [Nanoarchaeota archaeon]